MTYKEYLKLFETNKDGSFVRLIIPAGEDYPELNLIDKKPAEYSLDEIVLAKQYAGELFKTVDKNTIE